MTPQQLQTAARALQAGKHDEAARILRDALKASPRDFQGLYLLGYAELRRKNHGEAERLFAAAVALNPSQPDLHYNRGCALQEMGREAEAVESFDRALLLNPRYAEAEFNRATALLRLRRFEEAALAFEDLIRRQPQDAEGWHNYAEALSGLGRKQESFEALSHALLLAPNSTRTLDKRASALVEARLFEEAVGDYEKLLALDPVYEYAQGSLLYARLNCCDWRDVARQMDLVESGVKARKFAATPLAFILMSDSPKWQRLCAETWIKKQGAAKPEPLWRGERYGHEKIRIAYLSGDFRNHAVSQLLTGVIEAHDRSKFEIIGISFGQDDDSALRTRLKKSFDRFVDADRMSDGDIAQLLRENEIDIAVDLMVYTGKNRVGVFSYRAAPVQVNFLGFPGTSGGPHLDYIIADRIVIPEADRLHYSEKIVTLPDTFQPNDRARRIEAATPSRASHGLPESGFVFCSFNNSCKILPDVFDIWMRLLQAVPGAALWLPQYAPTQEANLRREAEARGVDPARIVFAAIVPTTEEYMARLALADLFLDTLPYNAHTTASNALWMGVPALTRIGTSYAGRVAASLLHAAGLDELVTATKAEYEAKALELARDPAALAALKEKVRNARDNSPLFDTLRYTRNLEVAFMAMAERTAKGEAPAHIAISAPA
jgi:protein O-GlcNAc transferase